MGFSNTPGPIKPIFYKDPKSGELVQNVGSQSYLMVAGDMGLILCAISQCGQLRMSLTSDDSVLTDQQNKQLLSLVYQNLQIEINKIM